jgi:Spy/CpxP family protein refolding chaperone
MNKLRLVLLLGVSLCLARSTAFAQLAGTTSMPTVSEQDIQLLRSDVRSEKKQLVAANMNLTDAQAVKFWPVYDAYTQETTKLSDARYALIKEYAKVYDTMTDAQADDLLKRMAPLDQSAASLREDWIPKFRQVLTGKQTALFFQLDRRINLIIDLQIAAVIPLVK